MGNEKVLINISFVVITKDEEHLLRENLAMFSASYVFTKYRKLWELEKIKINSYGTGKQ